MSVFLRPEPGHLGVSQIPLWPYAKDVLTKALNLNLASGMKTI